jgi:hypothetical protein
MAFYGFFTRASEFGGGIDNLTATYHDTAYTDRAVQFVNEKGGAISWGTALTDVWIHWRQYFNGTHNTNADGYWWTVIDSSGQNLARADISNGTTAYQVYDGGGGFTASAYVTSPGIGVQTDVDIHIQVNSGGNNIITAYHDGVQVATASEPWIDSTGAFTLILNAIDIGQGSGDDWYISEMMVADEDTRGLRLATLIPDAVGGETSWSGAFGDVTDRADGSAISSATAAQRTSFNVGAYGGPATPTAVRGVFVQCWATAGASGPTQIEPFLRISATNYDSTTIVAPTFEKQVIGEWATNPNTAVAWVGADFASLEIGVESVT